MGGVKRTRDGVDALEHAMGGVHTTDSDGRLVSLERNPGRTDVGPLSPPGDADDSPVEREVIVHLNGQARRRDSRGER